MTAIKEVSHKRHKSSKKSRSVLRNSSINNQKLQVTPLDVAFVQLRGLLPAFMGEEKMDKVDIIRHTLRYIVMLRQILGEQQARQQEKK